MLLSEIAETRADAAKPEGLARVEYIVTRVLCTRPQAAPATLDGN